MAIRFFLLQSFALIICTNTLYAQEPLNKIEKRNVVVVKPKAKTSYLEFYPYLQALGTGEIKLANGEVADKIHWQGLLVAKFEGGDGSYGYCTASLIGPNVILTAAHCLDTGGENLVTSVRMNKSKIGMSCSSHPAYANAPPSDGLRAEQDYALCLLEKEIKEIAYETIDLSNQIQVGNQVVMTGYGCTKVRIDRYGELKYDQSEDVLRIGVETISAIDTSPITFEEGNMFYTMSPANTEPTLCPGDSGGPVFVLTLNANLRAATNRRVIGVNSAVSWYRKDLDSETDFYSYFAPLNHLAFRDFLKEWRQQHTSALVCGVGNYVAGTLGCRE